MADRGHVGCNDVSVPTAAYQTAAVDYIGGSPSELEPASTGPGYRLQGRATKRRMNPGDSGSDAPASVPNTLQVTDTTLDAGTAGAVGNTLTVNDTNWLYGTTATNKRSTTAPSLPRAGKSLFRLEARRHAQDREAAAARPRAEADRHHHRLCRRGADSGERCLGGGLNVR